MIEIVTIRAPKSSEEMVARLLQAIPKMIPIPTLGALLSLQ